MARRGLFLVCALLAYLFSPNTTASAQSSTTASSGTAQSGTAAVTGRVVDKETGAPLSGVNIQVVDTGFGGISNPDGSFHLRDLPAGPYRLQFSFIGFDVLILPEIRLAPGAREDVGTVALTPGAIPLGEFVVTPGSYSIMGGGIQKSQILKREDLENMSFAEDITRAATRLPGVASTDYSSRFTVRGGESDEILMTLDGMELYEPFHQRDFVGGLFSIVDIETIDGIDLMTGGFSAEYGDRQSGVFGMRTKDAGDERRTSVGLSVMNARLYTSGPVSDGEGTYLLSARRGVLDKVKILSVVDGETTHYFQDAMGKLEVPLNSKHSLSGHVLLSGDKAEVRDITEDAHDIHDTKYDNVYAWAALRSHYSPKVYSRTLTYFGDIGHERNGDSEKDEYTDRMNFKLKDKRDYTFYGIKQDWIWDPSSRASLRAGFDLKGARANYDYSYSLSDLRADSSGVIGPFENSLAIKTKPSGRQTGIYVSSRLNPRRHLYVETGLRYDDVTWSGDQLVSPRVGLAYSLGEQTTVRGAWGYYYQSQFMNDLDVNHGNTTFDPAELSKHYVLGVEHTLENGLDLRVDGYWKQISRISDAYQNLRDPWEVFPEARNDEVFLQYGDAHASGVEFFLKYDEGRKVSWWASYALAEAVETIESIRYDGLLVRRTGELPRPFDQRHTVYLDMNYRPTSRWHINVSWQYHSGWPLTTYTYVANHEYSDPPPDDLFMAAAHDGFRADRYPAYHRMDVRVNRTFPIKTGVLKTYLHVINAYNRENMRKFDVDATLDGELVPDGNGSYEYFRDDTTWFGLLPVLGVSWEF
ncbi:MAG: TonB-dependent receptor [Candidatus Eisenbacteria bacterium]|nr:TonB-dependent receptor [Candidatus Eisenbacteria bacterium]